MIERERVERNTGHCRVLEDMSGQQRTDETAAAEVEEG